MEKTPVVELLKMARRAFFVACVVFALASCGSSGDVATDDGDDLAQILQALEEAEAAEQSQVQSEGEVVPAESTGCLLYTSPSPRDQRGSRMPSSA